MSIATVTASVISFLFSTLPGKLLIHAVIFILALTGFCFIISWQSNTRKIKEVAVSKIFFYTSDVRIVEFTTESLALQGREEVSISYILNVVCYNPEYNIVK